MDLHGRQRANFSKSLQSLNIGQTLAAMKGKYSYDKKEKDPHGANMVE